MDATDRCRPAWAVVLILPVLAVAMVGAIADRGALAWNRGLPPNLSFGARWRDPTLRDEYAARAELRRVLARWRSHPGVSSSDLTPPLARILNRWPRTDAAWRAMQIVCPLGADPIEEAWQAVNRPFRREVPELYDEQFRE